LRAAALPQSENQLFQDVKELFQVLNQLFHGLKDRGKA
jgi:uncharacterized protein YoxC